MADIIEHNFQDQERINSHLVFLNSKISADTKVYAYYLLDLVKEISSHFWNNYQTLKIDLEQYHSYQFDNQVKYIRAQITDILECFEAGADGEIIYDMLKFRYSTDICSLLEWLEKIDLPYRQAKIIDINNYKNINKV